MYSRKSYKHSIWRVKRLWKVRRALLRCQLRTEFAGVHFRMHCAPAEHICSLSNSSFSCSSNCREVTEAPHLPASEKAYGHVSLRSSRYTTALLVNVTVTVSDIWGGLPGSQPWGAQHLMSHVAHAT